jgi:hypothetical protein
MWPALGAAIDLVHALLMAAWVIGLPLLFWHRWPRLTRAYGIYAIAFIVVSQVSQAILDECFLTTLARTAWLHDPVSGAPAPVSDEWFTVRLARAIFDLTPSHRSIKLLSEALILVTAVGVLFVVHRRARAASPAPPPHGRDIWRPRKEVSS